MASDESTFPETVWLVGFATRAIRTHGSQGKRSRFGGRQLRPLHRAAQDAELVPKSEVLQVECGSNFEGVRPTGSASNTGGVTYCASLCQNAIPRTSSMLLALVRE